MYHTSADLETSLPNCHCWTCTCRCWVSTEQTKHLFIVNGEKYW